LLNFIVGLLPKEWKQTHFHRKLGCRHALFAPFPACASVPLPSNMDKNSFHHGVLTASTLGQGKTADALNG
jgi:hypothetical protein